MSGGIDYSRLKIIEALPHSSYHPTGREDLLRSLRGATIVHLGSVKEAGIEGGGLFLDYVPRGSKKGQRVVFAFTELGCPCRKLTL